MQTLLTFTRKAPLLSQTCYLDKQGFVLFTNMSHNLRNSEWRTYYFLGEVWNLGT